MELKPIASPEHNYVRKIEAMYDRGELPRTIGVHQILVYHDDWCGIYQEQRCDCNPDVQLAWSLPASNHN